MKITGPFCISIFFLSVQLLAQSGGKKTMDEMLENGRKSRERFILKTNPIAMISGDFPLYVELRLSRKITLEAGAGVQAPYYGKEWIYIVSGKSPFATAPEGNLQIEGGYSLRFFPKYYLFGDNLEGAAIGPFWRRRQYNVQGFSEPVQFTDLCLVFSQQGAFGKSPFFFEYYVGFGRRTPHFPTGFIPVNGERHVVSPWGIKLGYGF